MLSPPVWNLFKTVRLVTMFLLFDITKSISFLVFQSGLPHVCFRLGYFLKKVFIQYSFSKSSESLRSGRKWLCTNKSLLRFCCWKVILKLFNVLVVSWIHWSVGMNDLYFLLLGDMKNYIENTVSDCRHFMDYMF